MQGKDYWYGREVEGRLFGLYTLFNRHKQGEITNKVHHLYYTIEFWNVRNAISIMESFVEDYQISIEVDSETYLLLTPTLKVKAHIIYRIKDTNVFDLKDTDSIFVDGNTFNVLCFTKHNSLRVKYNDYANDVHRLETYDYD